MSKPWNKKPNPVKPVKPPREPAHKGQCDISAECAVNGGEILHCITCEKLATHGKRDVPFKIQTCAGHRDEATRRIRRHAMIAHPANILRVAAAALRGEQV